MSEDVLIDGALRSWRTTMDRAGKFFTSRSDEELQTTVAPERNRLIYLWGHLTAVNDRMIPLLGLGSRLFVELDEVFIVNPDRAVSDRFAAREIGDRWKRLDEFLWEKFATMSVSQWLDRHEAVSEEEFKAQPHRNRFGILLNRTNHISFHLGQAILTRR